MPRTRASRTPPVRTATLLAAGLLAAGFQPTPLLALQMAAGGALEAEAVRREGAITIDGRLDEADWARARPIQGFVATEPVEGVPALHDTEVFVLHDETAIYIGARMHDPEPGTIYRQLTRRGELGDATDYFEVSLDTNLDRRTAFRFRVSAAGVQADAYRYDDTSVDQSWEGVWESAVQVGPDGWTAELRIPLSQLRYAPSPQSQSWGVNFARRRNASAETSFWALESRVIHGAVSVFGTLHGLNLPRESRAWELRPYVLARQHSAPAEAGNPFFDGRERGYSMGLDVRYGLGSTFVLEGTFNPDFGQVEVDPAVINLTAFETFYPERRPFFTRDSQLFNFSLSGGQNTLFYSRRIGRAPQGRGPSGSDHVDVPAETTILGALKLTGRTRGGLTLGVLTALTQEERARAQWEHEHLGSVQERFIAEPSTFYGVASAEQELREGATQVTGIVTLTSRNLPSNGSLDELTSEAVGVGMSFDHAFHDRSWGVWGFLAGTYVRGSPRAITRIQRAPNHYFQRPDAHYLSVDSTATSMAGREFRLQLEKRSGRWLPSIWIAEVSPGFEVNDLGRGQVIERLDGGVRLVYREIQPGRVFRNYNFNLSSIHNWRHEALDDPFSYSQWFDQALQTGRVTLQTNATFLNYWGVSFGNTYRRRALSDGATRGGPLMVSPEGWTSTLTVNSDTRARATVRPSLSLDWDAEGGGALSLGVTFGWRPTEAAEISFTPEFERRTDMAQYVTTARDEGFEATFGSRYLFAELERREIALPVRVNWAFSPALTLQVYAQPILSSGDFVTYKQLERSSSFDFDVFEEGQAMADGTGGVSCVGGRTCVLDGVRFVDFEGTGAADLSFSDRHFNQRSLRGSAVLRWEYRPGSTVFLVWQQDRTSRENIGDFSMERDARALFRERPANTFILKVNRWLGG